MHKALNITTTRRRAAVTAFGLTAAAAFAVPGVAWANDAIPSTAPVVVSIPATQTEATSPVCATTPAHVLSREEVDALIAKGELVEATTVPTAAGETAGDPAVTVVRTDAIDMGTAVPTTAAVAVDDASATVIRLAELVGQGQTVADLIARGTDALNGTDAAVTFSLPTC